MINKFHLIINRINLLTSMTIDVASFIVLIISFNILDINMLFNIPIFLYISQWIIISYIFGRYSKINRINSTYAINQISKSIILFLIVLFQCLNLEFFNDFNIKFILIFSLISIFFQYLFDLWLKNKSLEKWYFIGDKNILKKIIKEIRISGINMDIYPLKDSGKILNISSKFSNNVIISDEKNDYELLIKKLINQHYSIKFKFLTISEFCEIALERYPVNLINNNNPVLRGSYKYGVDFQYRIKRVSDVLLSLIILFTLSPIIFICCLLIFFEDRGPIFYIQKRIGLNRQEFNIIKLRTMVIDAEKEGPKWATNNDKRVTKIGKLLRKSRIDELPQLINVLRGKMSLIGPRPEREIFESEIMKHIPHYHIRHRVLPGISGWAQVNYPYGSSLIDAENKLSYDLYYYRNFSLMFDTIIFIKTIKLVLNAKFSEPIKLKKKLNQNDI